MCFSASHKASAAPARQFGPLYVKKKIPATFLECDVFPRLVGAMKDRNRADPFVIALAKLKGAIVVT